MYVHTGAGSSHRSPSRFSHPGVGIALGLIVAVLIVAVLVVR